MCNLKNYLRVPVLARIYYYYLQATTIIMYYLQVCTWLLIYTGKNWYIIIFFILKRDFFMILLIIGGPQSLTAVTPVEGLLHGRETPNSPLSVYTGHGPRVN